MFEIEAEKPEVIVELDRCTCKHCDIAQTELSRLCHRFGAVLKVIYVESEEPIKKLAGWKTPMVYLNGKLLTTVSTPVKKWEQAIRQKASDALFTISGEVIDLECHLKHEHRGEKHAECARSCLERGEPVGLLTGNEQVYLLLADPEQRKALINLAAMRVDVEGEIFRKGGVQSIVVHRVS